MKTSLRALLIPWCAEAGCWKPTFHNTKHKLKFCAKHAYGLLQREMFTDDEAIIIALSREAD